MCIRDSDWTMLRYTKAMVEKQRDLLTDEGDNESNSKTDQFNKIKVLAMKKFSTHFHYYKNDDKHNPTPEEIKQQSIENNEAASTLPQELLKAIDKGMETLKQQQSQVQVPGQQLNDQELPTAEPLLQQNQRETQGQQFPVAQREIRPSRTTYYPPTGVNQQVPPNTQPTQQQSTNNNGNNNAKPSGEHIWL